MTNPDQPASVGEVAFKKWIESHTFAAHGDARERGASALLAAQAPAIEEFWRQFIVPLTNRLTTRNESAIRFRAGVDPVLQYIAGANYSLFAHLTVAKQAIGRWDETTLDVVYTRLASAFDVFEALALKLHIVFLDCRGVKSLLLAGLTREEFLEIAGKYYDEKYPALHEFYAKIGKKPPPINIPTKEALLDEFLKATPCRKSYLTISGQIRSFRNALVHDVMIGNVVSLSGKIYVPLSAKIAGYRRWSDVARAANDPKILGTDFCEVTAQCEHEIGRTLEVINQLYQEILRQFNELFWVARSPRIHALWGIQLLPDGFTPPSQPPSTHNSQSFQTGGNDAPTTLGPGLSGVFNGDV